MTAIAKALRSSKSEVTNQALADLALYADQERRAALRRGDKARAKELDEEVQALTALME